MTEKYIHKIRKYYDIYEYYFNCKKQLPRNASDKDIIQDISIKFYISTIQARQIINYVLKNYKKIKSEYEKYKV